METSKNWRELVADWGKQRFQSYEMLRLGFTTREKAKNHDEQFERLLEKYKESAVTNARIADLNSQVTKLGSIQNILDEIRRKRIERVNLLRGIRKEEKTRELVAHKSEVRERKLSKPYFLGDGVSADLKFDEPDTEKLSKAGLPVIRDLSDMSALSGLTREELVWLSFERKVSTIDHYQRFEIPKRNGTKRLISSPKPAMRKAQSWIRSEIVNQMQPLDYAMAFRPGKSIVDNAQAHQGAKVIIRMDLTDFFPSITFRRVKGFFKSCGYSGGVASVLALLTTDAPRVYVNTETKTRVVAKGERGLPQGACTSPDIANLIARRLDARLGGMAGSNWVYTRYADDLTFSSSNPNANVNGVLKLAKQIIEEESFTVNEKKTSVKRASGRMMVTGLVVDENEVRLSRRDVRRIRAFLHMCDTKGLDKVSEEIGKSAKHVATGYVSYMHMVSPEQAQKYKDKYSWL